MSNNTPTDRPTHQRNVYALLVICTFFWGANFNLGKYVLASVNPLTAAAWRFMLAAVIMVLVILWQEKPDWQGICNNIFALLVLALLGIFGFNICFFYGLQQTTSINAALITTLNPTITVVLAAVVFKDSINGQQVLGLLLSMLGIIVVTTGGSWFRLMNLHFATGDLVLLMGNVCWALYSILGRRWIKNLSNLQSTAITMLIGALAITGLALFTHGGALEIPTSPNLFALIMMAVFGTVIAYLCWNNGIRTIGPAKTSVFFDLVPIFTMLIAITLGEHILLAQWLGAVLVMTGVLFSSGALEDMRKIRIKVTVN